MTDPTPTPPLVPSQTIYVVQGPPRGFSITSLILGLCSILFGFTFLVPLGALIFGIIGIRREPAGRGMAIAGIVIGALFMLFWLALGGAIFALFATLIGVGATYS
ncbi:MAG: DUF4190 domain-containing protein [Rhodoglobus sp.]